MKCRFLFLLILPLSILVNAKTVEVIHRCLRSESNPPIRLEWRQFSTQNPNWTSAYIRYNNNQTVIPIVLKYIGAEVRPPGQPLKLQTGWSEVVEAKITGEYTIDTDGGNVLNFSYHNRKTKKTYSFIQDNQAYKADGCHWQ